MHYLCNITDKHGNLYQLCSENEFLCGISFLHANSHLCNVRSKQDVDPHFLDSLSLPQQSHNSDIRPSGNLGGVPKSITCTRFPFVRSENKK